MSDIRDEHEHVHDERCLHSVPEAQMMHELRKGESLYHGTHGFHMKLAEIGYKGHTYEGLAIHDGEHRVLAFAPNLEHARHLLSLLEAEASGREILQAIVAEEQHAHGQAPPNIRDLRN